MTSRLWAERIRSLDSAAEKFLSFISSIIRSRKTPMIVSLSEFDSRRLSLPSGTESKKRSTIKDQRVDYRKCFNNSGLSPTAKRFSPRRIQFNQDAYRMAQTRRRVSGDVGCTAFLYFVLANYTLNAAIRNQPHQRDKHIDAACDPRLKKGRQDCSHIEER